MNSARNYSLVDSNPLEGVYYYRLKIVDTAGKKGYSNIRAVKRTAGAVPIIYPNPTTTSLTLLGKSNGYFEIYDLSGCQLIQAEARTEKS